jgi:Peptidase inhibitor I78 family
MRPFLPLILAAGLLQACTLEMPQPVPPQTDLTSCYAVGLEGLVGAPVRLLPANGAWSALRIIRPGDMVTMDYSPTRLNVRVNAMDIILSLSCG